MTAFDRIEPQLPQLMDELAPARVPDYFDDMLRQSARTRQRPAWSALERWLPMGVIARTAPVRQAPWRPIVVAAVLIILATASLVLYAGSRPHPLPAPFGPAANGEILIGTKDGEIAALDLLSGKTRPMITGKTVDDTPVFAADGRTFQFGRTSDDAGIWVADADGSGAHRVFDLFGTYVVDAFDWTQAGDRIVVLAHGTGAEPVVLLVDPATSAMRTIRPGRTFLSVAVPYGGDHLLLSDEMDGNARYWLMDADDPTNPRQLAVSAFAINAPALSPDGTKITYATWNDGVGSGANLHVQDLVSGTDTRVTPAGNRLLEWQAPLFMPDGKSILADRWNDLAGLFQLVVVPADGSGPDRPIGPVRTQHSGGAVAYISPDGSTILAVYHDNGVSDGKIWSIDVASGQGTELSWPAPEHLTWQRQGR